MPLRCGDCIAVLPKDRTAPLPDAGQKQTRPVNSPLQLRPPRLHRRSQLLQHRHGLLQADAGIGHGHAMRQRLAVHDVLPPFLQMAFDHQPRDAGIATGNLLGHVGRHVDLAAVLLAAVGVGDIDHDLRAQACAFQQSAGGLYMLGAVVGLLAAAQDDVAVAIAAGLEDGGLAHLGHAHEGVGRAGRLDGIAGHLDAAVRAVLEAHGAGQAAGQLAVALAFRGARACLLYTSDAADE